MDRELFEHRKRIALAQLDAFIDVTTAWRGRCEDDNLRAGLGWISEVIGRTSDYENGGHLLNRDGEPALAWQIEGGVWQFGSLVKGYKWPMTRRQFRNLAKQNGVSLPTRHVLIWHERQRKCEAAIVGAISQIKRSVAKLQSMRKANRADANLPAMRAVCCQDQSILDSWLVEYMNN